MGNSASAKIFSTDQIPDLQGKIALVTGANIGIGYAISKALASKGATVIVSSRNEEKVNAAVAELKKLTGNNNISGEVVDLSSLSSIDRFAASVTDNFDHIDLLINNAAVFIPPPAKTEQGFEVTLGTNAIGNAYVTSKLLSLVQKSASGRIITLSSGAVNSKLPALFKRIVLDGDIGGSTLGSDDTSFEIYCLSKQLQSLYTQELARRSKNNGSSIFISCADPGMVLSDIQRKTRRDTFFTNLMAFLTV